MKTIFRSASAGAISAFALLIAMQSAGATTAFGHRSDPEACLSRTDKSADETILACWKALNSHLLTRNGIAYALNNLAIAYKQKGDWDSALNALNAAVKLEGDTWQTFVNRGGVYDHLNKPDLALADFNRAIELNSGQAVCYRMRGEFYLNQQKVDLAEADFTRALAFDPKEPRSLYMRSQARQRLGDTSGASADMALAKQLDQNVENASGIDHTPAVVPVLDPG